MLTNIKQGLLRLKDDLLIDGAFGRVPASGYSLSKADLFPDWDVYSFRDLVIERATEHLDALRMTLRSLWIRPSAVHGRGLPAAVVCEVPARRG